jgi:cation-transporting ATPase E
LRPRPWAQRPCGAADRDRALVSSSALTARANNRLLVWLIVLAVPLAIVLTISVFSHNETAGLRVQTLTAGIVNPIPEGLIVLISVTAAVSAFKLAQRGVLAQQLNAIESLASVDTPCTDKTGTLTEPKLRVVAVVPAHGEDEASVARELAPYAGSSQSRNLTLEALADADLNLEGTAWHGPRMSSGATLPSVIRGRTSAGFTQITRNA